ncbi:MAG: response regulator transcription factor, partial [Treponema sp.]|nr:response regulator transcription factor [Treponema sp.]
MITILVVEDDEKLNRVVCAHLTEQGYKAVGCLSVVEAFDRMIDNIIGLIISDIMMPEIDGFKFAAMVREQDKLIPILFITARDDISSKQKGFRIGIDDYMVKPVDMDELTLRVGALLRRANIVNEKKLTAGSLVLNADEMTAAAAGKEIPLTVREFNVLWKLLSYPKKTFTRNQLM